MVDYSIAAGAFPRRRPRRRESEDGRQEPALPDCPRCQADYPFAPLFDHHPRRCPSCRTEVIELATITVVYLIDPEAAPPIIRELLGYLDRFTEPEAERELTVLMNFLGVEPVV